MTFLNVHGVDVPISRCEVSEGLWLNLLDNSYRPNTAEFAVKAVQPNDRILELGTGLGIVTTLLAGVEGVRVWSFEANPEMASLASKIVRANNGANVTVFHGLPMPGPSREFGYYVRAKPWLSSLSKEHGTLV